MAAAVNPVPQIWEGIEWVVQAAQRGGLATISPKLEITRRDVVNNADLLGPLIEHMGVLANRVPSTASHFPFPGQHSPLCVRLAANHHGS